MQTIIFDTETTGLVKPESNELNNQPYILEICCYKFEGTDLVDTFNTFLKPPRVVPAEITKITGINGEMVESAPTFADAYSDLADFFLGVERLVAHNLAFDRNLLLFELARIEAQFQFPWPKQHICTVERTMHYEQRRMSLSRLYKHLFGYDFANAHRAENDVKALSQCYFELVKRDVIK